MQAKPLVLFDMDGVLLDSAQAIVESLQFALHSVGQSSHSRTDLGKFVGPPLHSMVEELLPNASLDVKQLFVKSYREHNNKFGPELTPIFDGIPELLSNLGRDFDLIVATSKLESAAISILKSKNLDTFFESIFGTRPESTDTKADVIGRAITSAKSTNVIAMVGDRVHDIEGAKEHNLCSIGVTWGYALPDELIHANPTHIADSPSSLEELIRSLVCF